MTLSKHAKEIHRKAVVLHSNSGEPVKGPKKRLVKKVLSEMGKELRKARKAVK